MLIFHEFDVHINRDVRDADHMRLIWQFKEATMRAQNGLKRNILDITHDVFVMHRAWNGPWCIPMSECKDPRANVFEIDHENEVYRCLVCGTAWPYLNAKELNAADRTGSP